MPWICACGCGKPLDVAKAESRADPGYLNPDQAEAMVAGIWVHEDTTTPTEN